MTQNSVRLPVPITLELCESFHKRIFVTGSYRTAGDSGVRSVQNTVCQEKRDQNAFL